MSSGCKRDYVLLCNTTAERFSKARAKFLSFLDFEIQIILEKILRSALVSCNINCLVYLQSYN